MTIPREAENVTLTIGRKRVPVTNVNKVFFPEIGVTKGDLLQYYADVADVLLPHIAQRAMVMKRYPHGATGEFFFMKRTPQPHPEWLRTCRIEHDSGNVIDFPMIDDLAALMWVINLGCIDLNQWYARCDDVDRPDYVHFDLDPGASSFAMVREVALLVRDGLQSLGMPSYAKTTGSIGMHVYVPIVRGPTQKEVWTFAKEFAHALARHTKELTTVAYHKDKRPKDRVLVDYNQNRWGATLASVYSVRPAPRASVSTPVTWDEVEGGIEIDDFRIDNVRERLAELGDLWKPMVAKKGRFNLAPLLG
jgi:bifunctional non-homologous end joining protein LigD